MADYIFKRKSANNIEFVGDFEGLYSNEDNPWSQSQEDTARDEPMSYFYGYSRPLYLRFLKKILKSNSIVAEIGCGLGETTALLANNTSNIEFFGVDISQTAIEKAIVRHKKIDFFCGDILKGPTFKKANVIILSNMLWYVLHDLENLRENIERSFKQSGESRYLVVQNALLKGDQSYGKEKVSSIGDMTDLFIELFSKDRFTVSCFSEFHKLPETSAHDFGLLALELKV
jgi:SAM-dependent methyltransferase